MRRSKEKMEESEEESGEEEEVEALCWGGFSLCSTSVNGCEAVYSRPFWSLVVLLSCISLCFCLVVLLSCCLVVLFSCIS